MEVGAAKTCMVSMDVTADEFVRVGISHAKGPSKPATSQWREPRSPRAGSLPEPAERAKPLRHVVR